MPTCGLLHTKSSVNDVLLVSCNESNERHTGRLLLVSMWHTLTHTMFVCHNKLHAGTSRCLTTVMQSAVASSSETNHVFLTLHPDITLELTNGEPHHHHHPTHTHTQSVTWSSSAAETNPPKLRDKMSWEHEPGTAAAASTCEPSWIWLKLSFLQWIWKSAQALRASQLQPNTHFRAFDHWIHC